MKPSEFRPRLSMNCSTYPQVTINEIFRGTMPYIWIVVAFMVLMYAFPGMALWLPKYMYG